MNNIQDIVWLSNMTIGQFVYHVSDLSQRYAVVSCVPTGKSMIRKCGTYDQFSERLFECHCVLRPSPPAYDDTPENSAT